MLDSLDILDAVLAELKRLRTRIIRGRTVQVQSRDDIASAKATAYSWLKNHRTSLSHLGEQQLRPVDALYSQLLAAADRSTLRGRYKTLLTNIAQSVTRLRDEVISNPAVAKPTEAPPDFSLLVGDPAMQKILVRRWAETCVCVDEGAPLAATVMMGAILEALLLSRANQVPDKRVLVQAKSAPKDRAGKVIPLQDWMLKGYLDVFYELGWLRQPARDVGVLLRDYRNYIHPAKELSHGIQITPEDAAMLWGVCASLARQLAKP